MKRNVLFSLLLALAVLALVVLFTATCEPLKPSVTDVQAGDGLTRTVSGRVITLTVRFGDSGSAVTTARSDHDHGGIYAPEGHAHDDLYYTEKELNTRGGGGQVHWGNLTGMPDGFADGMDDTGDAGGDITAVYAGTGLTGGGDSGDVTLTLDTAYTDGRYWSLAGNAGTTPGTNFLGTTDKVSLTLVVSGTAALRLEPNATSPNIIGGHSGNSVAEDVVGATIAGGGGINYTNQVTGIFGTIGGGAHNTAGKWGTVSGGYSNTVSYTATVSGGQDNIASGPWSTVGGGWDNRASDNKATVGGGAHNEASGWGATVPGGRYNTAQGRTSFAAGFCAKATHNGAFVWADCVTCEDTDPCKSKDPAIFSPAENTFIVRANGGIWFGQATTAFTPTISSDEFITTSTGAYLSKAGKWISVSDGNLKENFAPVDGQEVLERLAAMPVTTWNHKAEDPSIRHMGPTAQDLYAAFVLGRDDRHIDSLDANGVALAAIQGLYQLSQEQAAHIQTLETENAALQQRLDGLEARMAALEAASAGSMASTRPLPTGLLPGVGVLLREMGGGK